MFNWAVERAAPLLNRSESLFGAYLGQAWWHCSSFHWACFFFVGAVKTGSRFACMLLAKGSLYVFQLFSALQPLSLPYQMGVGFALNLSLQPPWVVYVYNTCPISVLKIKYEQTKTWSSPKNWYGYHNDVSEARYKQVKWQLFCLL